MYKINANISCSDCINKIEKEVNTVGKLVDYNFSKGYIIVDVEDNKIMFLIVKLKKLGFEVGDYEVVSNKNNMIKDVLIMVSMVILFLLGSRIFPSLEVSDLFNIIFILIFGFLSVFHCISMCGAIAIRQSQGNNELAYYIGRIISYTTIGFLLGLLGGVISISESLMLIVAMLSGAFLVLLGLSTIDLVKLPRFKVNVNRENKSSLILGLLNGILPCAVLQIMWLYVITLANPFYGAITMFLIAIISSFALFGFSRLSKKLSFFKSKIFRYVLAFYVVFLGINMISNSFMQFTNPVAVEDVVTTSNNVDKEYIMNMNYEMNKAIPVNQEVTIYFDETGKDGCNEKFTIIFPDGQKVFVDTNKVYSITINVSETGTAKVECWMGMRGGSFEVE